MLIKYISKEGPYGSKSSSKYFIGYNDNDVIRPLCMKLPQMIGYVQESEGNKQCLSRLMIANC